MAGIISERITAPPPYPLDQQTRQSVPAVPIRLNPRQIEAGEIPFPQYFPTWPAFKPALNLSRFDLPPFLAGHSAARSTASPTSRPRKMKAISIAAATDAATEYGDASRYQYSDTERERRACSRGRDSRIIQR